ncbi:hypothetical protein C0991_000842, partial [Blastosporella zonata]
MQPRRAPPGKKCKVNTTVEVFDRNLSSKKFPIREKTSHHHTASIITSQGSKRSAGMVEGLRPTYLAKQEEYQRVRLPADIPNLVEQYEKLHVEDFSITLDEVEEEPRTSMRTRTAADNPMKEWILHNCEVFLQELL